MDDDEDYLSDLANPSDIAAASDVDVAAASDVATQALAVATRPPPTVAAAPAADVHPRATRGGTRDHMSWMRYGKLRSKLKTDSLKQATAIASFADKISKRVQRGSLKARQARTPRGCTSKAGHRLGLVWRDKPVPNGGRFKLSWTEMLEVAFEKTPEHKILARSFGASALTRVCVKIYITHACLEQ